MAFPIYRYAQINSAWSSKNPKLWGAPNGWWLWIKGPKILILGLAWKSKPSIPFDRGETGLPHLCKNDWNTKNISSKNTWSTWTRKSYGVQRYPAWVWVGPALGLRAKKFKIWSHGTKIFGSKISLHKVIQVPWRYFVGFWNQNSFGGLTG